MELTTNFNTNGNLINNIEEVNVRTLRSDEEADLLKVLEKKRENKKYKNLEKLRCAIYARKSQEDTKCTSLITQVNYCRRIIESSTILEFVGSYQEDNRSGMWTDREELQKMMEEFRAGKIDVIVVFAWDRLSRNTADILKLTDEIRNKNGVVIAGDSVITINSASALLLQTIQWAMNEYHARQTAEKTLETMVNQAETTTKYISGTAPLGYDRNDAGRLDINVDESLVVNTIFTMILNGSTTTAISNHLNSRKYKTKQGNNFSKQSVEFIARNPLYKGTYIYNGKGRKKKAKRLVLQEYRSVEKPHQYTAIVDDETFDKVQEILNSRENSRTNDREHIYLLSGLIRCKQCGKMMIGGSNCGGAKKQKRYYYQCPNHKSSLCDSKDINAEYLENFVVDIVLESLKSIDIDEVLQKYLSQDINYEISLLKRNSKHIERRMEELVKITVRLETEEITPHLRNVLEKKMNGIALEVQEYESKVKEQEQYIAILKAFSIYDDFTREELLSDRIQARDLIKGIIKGITASDTDINIEL